MSSVALEYLTEDEIEELLEYPIISYRNHSLTLHFPFLGQGVTAKWGDGTKLDHRLNIRGALYATGLFSYIMIMPNKTGVPRRLPVDFRLAYPSLQRKPLSGVLMYPKP